MPTFLGELKDNWVTAQDVWKQWNMTNHVLWLYNFQMDIGHPCYFIASYMFNIPCREGFNNKQYFVVSN